MTSSNVNEAEKLQEELKWISTNYPKDDFWQKSNSKFLDNPFVPIGAAATMTALGCGLFNFYRNESLKQQLMMRCRVAAQGFTIVALMLGLYFESRSS